MSGHESAKLSADLPTVPLCSTPFSFFLDAVGFYKKFGFLEVIPPRMLAEGKVAGVSPFP